MTNHPMKTILTLFYFLLTIPKVNSFIFNTPIFPYIECYLRFLLLGFDFGAFHKFDVYFNENSVMRLAEAGTYVGPKSIEEYLSFQEGKYSPYFFRDATLHFQQKFQRYDRERNECIFNLRFLSQYITEPIYTGNETIRNTVVMTGARFIFDIRKISEINIFLPLGFLIATFDDSLNNDITRKYICSVANNDCANTTAPIDNCESRLAELPVFNDGSYVDGNSQGCRALHAVFAEINHDHCAHIALNATEDPNGVIKCQESSLMNATDYFTPKDFEENEEYMISQGIDPEIGYVFADYAKLETRPIDLIWETISSYITYLASFSFFD